MLGNPAKDSDEGNAMGKLKRILSFIDSMSEWTGKVISFLILVLSLIVGYEILMRYGFNRPTIWVNELSGMIFGTFIIFGGAFTARYNGHMGMDIVYGMLSDRKKAALDVISFFILFIPLLVVLVWKGGVLAWKSALMLEHDSSQWGPPLYPIRIMLPLGALLFLLQASAKLVRDLMVLFGHKEG
ncbi:MAG: TRAP transporter small permease subunit [Desulfobacteraceae bacterium]|nr:MAG: TRAP transporter small permease subunit [Desulfobacteraceae bacterium]